MVLMMATLTALCLVTIAVLTLFRLMTGRWDTSQRHPLIGVPRSVAQARKSPR